MDERFHFFRKDFEDQPLSLHRREVSKTRRHDRDAEVASTRLRTRMTRMEMALVENFHENGFQPLAKPRLDPLGALQVRCHVLLPAFNPSGAPESVRQ